MGPALKSDFRPYLPTAGRDFRPHTKRENSQRLQKDNQEIGKQFRLRLRLRLRSGRSSPEFPERQEKWNNA